MKMIRFPFAASIVCCFVSVAAAQQLPETTVNKIALSEQRTEVLRLFDLNPDCSDRGGVVAKVTKAGKGQIDFDENLGFSNYARDTPQYHCNTSPTSGVSIFYTVSDGVQGD